LRCEFFFLSWFFLPAQARTGNKLPDGLLKAKWIGHPTASGNDFGVFYFRKEIELSSVPTSYIIHVSADNKYRLL
jgi:hypothetical protein